MPKHKAEPREVTHLTEAQHRAVELIAAGELTSNVAQQVGATVDEIAAWRQMPAFIAAVNEVLTDARESTRQRLRAMAAQALDTVADVMGNATAAPQLRLQAALKVLDLVGAGEQAKEAIGATDPDDVAQEQARDRLMRDLF